jgi:hypothetical protein
MEKLGYLGIDQYGNHYNLKEHPRKELMEKLGYSHASIMYCDLKSGGFRRKGYVIGPFWVDVFEVHSVAAWN